MELSFAGSDTLAAHLRHTSVFVLCDHVISSPHMYIILFSSTLTLYFLIGDMELSFAGSDTLAAHLQHTSVFLLCDHVISSLHHVYYAIL